MRDWIAQQGFETLYIEPGSSWQNAYSESFNARLRDELLNREIFETLAEAKVLGKEYRRTYNDQRLYSSLGYQPPAEFARRCLSADSAALRRPKGNAVPASKPKTQTTPPATASHRQTLIRTGSNSRGRSLPCNARSRHDARPQRPPATLAPHSQDKEAEAVSEAPRTNGAQQTRPTRAAGARRRLEGCGSGASPHFSHRD